MSNSFRNRIVWLGLLAMPLMANRLAAQGPTPGPTPEGTTISNTATASFTDANNNTYSNVTATANVKVGFVGGIDVVAGGNVSPASPSTGNTASFSVYNTGNGGDTVVVTGVTAGSGLTADSLEYNGTWYANSGAGITALNAALATAAGTATNSYNSNVAITVAFTVASGIGGTSPTITLAAKSKRDGTKTDSAFDTANISMTSGVAVTPTNGTVNRLPGDATKTASFTVTNNGTGTDAFDLAPATDAAAVITGISITNCSPACTNSNSRVSLSAGGNATITVTYSVASTALAGTNSGNNTVKLAATSTNDNTKTATGLYTVTVQRASLKITKIAYYNSAGAPGAAIGDPVVTPGTTDRVLPGDTLWYKVTVTDTGAAAASTVSITDNLPSQLTYVSNSADTPTGGQSAWSVSYGAGTVTATLSAMAAAESRYYYYRVVVK